MSDHLQAFNKAIYARPLTQRLPVATDAAYMEKLSHKKRTDFSLADFAKTRGRDNKMYHLTDGFNLNKKEDNPVMDEYVSMLLYAKQRKYTAATAKKLH